MTKDIHKLIESYFDCILSEQEEQQLKQMLATTEEDTADVREAKAVLGVFAMERKFSKGTPILHSALTFPSAADRWFSIQHSQILRYAAAAIAIFAIVFGGMKYAEYQNDNACVMFVNGEKISNENIVLAQMLGQMDDISEAAEYNDQTMSNQLDDMASVLE